MLCRWVMDFHFWVMEKSWKFNVEKEGAPCCGRRTRNASVTVTERTTRIQCAASLLCRVINVLIDCICMFACAVEGNSRCRTIRVNADWIRVRLRQTVGT